MLQLIDVVLTMGTNAVAEIYQRFATSLSERTFCNVVQAMEAYDTISRLAQECGYAEQWNVVETRIKRYQPNLSTNVPKVLSVETVYRIVPVLKEQTEVEQDEMND